MDAFSGAWSSADHAAGLNDEHDDHFELSSPHRHSASELHGDEWAPFFQSLERDASTARYGLNFPELPFTSAGICGAPAVSELPLTSAYSTSSTSSSSVAPSHSPTEPVPSWFAPTSHPQSSFYSDLWHTQPSQFGNFFHDGLGIRLSSSLHQHDPREDVPFGNMFNCSSNDHVSLVKPEDDYSLNRANHQRPYHRDTVENDDDSDTDATDPCYAKLLWICLKEAPGNTLSLKELYEWVAQNSQKAKDPKTRGWQNSVRHNLSMNAAFERVPPCANQGAKKGSLWRLTDKALRDGVISTTRYRKDPKRKPERRGHPAPKRQISGARGGQATRAASRRQREMQHTRPLPYISLGDRYNYSQHRQHDSVMSPYSPHSTGHSPQLLMTPLSPTSPYHLGIDHEGKPPPLPSYHNTPPQVVLGFGDDAKPALSNFEFQHFDLTNGLLFRDQDEIMPDTPSMGTEASFLTDDCVPELLSGNMNGEATLF